jgi:NAD(P)-dependent dehydrogenase (short-subunit alcohol dehydrogenase family)
MSSESSMRSGPVLAAKHPKHTTGRKRADMKRTALVTGANRGIGLAIARQLAEPGNPVSPGSRNLKAGEDAVRSFHGLDIDPVHVDLTDPATIHAALNDIKKSGRHVDALAKNAGVLHEKPILELTDTETADSIAVHISGRLHLIRAGTEIIEREYGRQPFVRLGIVR